MRKILFISLLILLGSFITLAQESDYTRDTIFIRSQLNAINDVIFVDPDQAQPYLDSALNKSKEINFAYGFYSTYNYKAIKHFLNSDYNESIQDYSKALEYADPHKPEQKIRLYSNISLSYRLLHNQDSTLAYLLIVNEESKKYNLQASYQQSVLDLATFYLDKEDFVSAVKYFAETENNCENSVDSVFLVKAYSSLARFYHAVNNFDKAYDAFQKALSIDEASDDINFLAANYANLGECFFRLKNNYDTAIYFYRKSLEFALPYSLEKQRLIADVNIGNAFLENERLDSAYVYYLKAYNNPLIDKRQEIKAAVLINLGLFYNRDGQYEKACQFLKNGLEVAEEMELIKFQMNAYKELSKLKKQQGHFQEALEYYESYFNLSDSLKNIEANHQLAMVDYEKLMIKEKYNNELLVQENKAQQEQIGTQRIVLFLVILVVLSLSILLFVFWRNKRITKSLNKQLKESNNQLESTNLHLISQKEEMKALLMSKDRFVSMLGHDLKNPFSGLLGLLELMLDDWESLPDSEKKDGIFQLSVSARQTFEFLQSLLDWGKAQQGLIRPQPEKIKLKDIAEELSAVFFAQYSKKNIKVKTEIPDNFEVFSDRKLISHILQNFFTNAIKYSFEGDFILLKSREENGKVFICIQDQGIGIPRHKLDDLFNLDSNFNRLGTAGEASTGMGLILCKEYAQLIGGEIKVESQVDIGSEFCLIIDNKKNL